MSIETYLPGENAARIAAQVDELAHETADSLHGAASSIRTGGGKSSKAIEDLANGAAAKLDGAGTFIEEHDLKHAVEGSRQLVRRYPVEALALAAGLGFLSALAIRRLTQSHTIPADVKS
jgi:hypothetical protein